MPRPTKITREIVDTAKTYLATCIDKPILNLNGGITYVDVNLPSKVGLALFLKVSKQTVDNWSNIETHEINFVKQEDGSVISSPDDTLELRQEFLGIVTEILAEQEKRLIANGLGGLYKEKTTAMILSKHGYAEKTETDITSKGNEIKTSILPEVIAEADRILKAKKLE